MRSNVVPNPAAIKQTKTFAPWNLFSALLLVPEERSQGAALKVLKDYGINAYTAVNIADAMQLLRSRRLDLFIFDSDLPCLDQLACLQPSALWRGVAMALSAQNGLHLHSRRVNFTLPKPLSADMLARALKAAYTTLTQQRIATFRHTLPACVVSGTLVHRGWHRAMHQVNVLNMSQTGLCLNAPEPLPHGASLTMNLLLPDSSSAVHASGSIVWSHSNGRTGVAFDRSACPEMKKFQELLNGWLPPELGLAARI